MHNKLKKIFKHIRNQSKNRKISNRQKGKYIFLLKYMEKCYFLNSKEKYTIEKLEEETEIEKSIIKEIINTMYTKKYITAKKNFIIKYEGAIWLHEKIQSYNSSFNNQITVPISLSALFMSIGVATNNDLYKLMSLLIFIYVSYLINKQGKYTY